MAEEDSKAPPQAAPEPELAPYLLESARSSRSKCRTCKRKIEKGKLRLGILIEGPFGEGYLWHHLTCAARRRIEDVEAAYTQKAFEDGLAVPPLATLQALEEKATEARANRKELCRTLNGRPAVARNASTAARRSPRTHGASCWRAK